MAAVRGEIVAAHWEEGPYRSPALTLEVRKSDGTHVLFVVDVLNQSQDIHAPKQHKRKGEQP